MQNSSRKLLMVFILCICLQGLMFAPVFQGMNNFIVEVPETESDALEFEEDLMFVALGAIACGSALFSKAKKAHFDLEGASLLPDFPPPR